MSKNGEATSMTMLQNAKDGDNDSWRDLQHLYSPLIYYWCKSHGVAGQNAEEISATVLGKAFEGLQKFKHNGQTGAFRKWLRTITGNTISDSEYRNGLPDEALDSRVDLVSPISERANSVEVQILYTRAWTLIKAEFSDRDQKIFERVAKNGEAPKDVAEDMHVSRGAVYTCVNRIKKRVRTRFSGEIPPVGDAET